MPPMESVTSEASRRFRPFFPARRVTIARDWTTRLSRQPTRCEYGRELNRAPRWTAQHPQATPCSCLRVCMRAAQCICGFSTMDNVALLNLEGTGMAGLPGIAARLFGALQRKGISVILISQAGTARIDARGGSDAIMRCW